MFDLIARRPDVLGRGVALVTALVMLGGGNAGAAASQSATTLPSQTALTTPTVVPLSTAVPTPEGAPSATPTTAASPIATSATLGGSDTDRPLWPGTYRVSGPVGVPFQIAFPTQWTLKTFAPADVQFLNTAVNGGDGAAWVVVDLVDQVFADPCNLTGGTVKPDPWTVDGIVTALTHMVGFTAGAVSDASLGAYNGKSVVLTNSVDTDAAGCTDGGMLHMWTFNGGSSGTNGLARDKVWVIDVRGTLVLVDKETFPWTPAGSLIELDQVVESIAF